jgi:hypothetical protein
MFCSSWLRKWTTNPGANRSAARRSRKPRFRPTLEILENRAVPAALNVTTPLDIVDPNDGVLSLREAVLQANATNMHDTIVLPGGTYLLNGGELTITSQVTIAGAGAGATIIDGGGAHRVFHLTSFAKQVTISGVTIQSGYADYGGGIFSEGSGLTLDHSNVSGNSGLFGGGIAAFGVTTMTVDHSTVAGNAATFRGGGLYVDFTYAGAIVVKDSTITSNSAGDAGGIFAVADLTTLTIKDSTISGNSASSRGLGGGVMAISSVTLNVKDSTISGNTAGQGGGIWASGYTVVTVKDSEISGNSAFGEGGGIFGIAFSLTVEHSSLSGNTALVGGGLDARYSTVEIDQSTLDDPIGGGIFNDTSTIHLKKTVVDGVFYDNQDYF